MKIMLLPAAAVAGFLVIADLVFVSDEERIEDLVDEGKRAVEEGDFVAVEARISLDYDFDRKDRAAFLDMARKVLDEFSPMGLMLWNVRITVEEGDTALVELLAIATPKERSRLPGTVKCPWKIHLIKEEGEWRVSGVKPVF